MFINCASWCIVAFKQCEKRDARSPKHTLRSKRAGMNRFMFRYEASLRRICNANYSIMRFRFVASIKCRFASWCGGGFCKIGELRVLAFLSNARVFQPDYSPHPCGPFHLLRKATLWHPGSFFLLSLYWFLNRCCSYSDSWGQQSCSPFSAWIYLYLLYPILILGSRLRPRFVSGSLMQSNKTILLLKTT